MHWLTATAVAALVTAACAVPTATPKPTPVLFSSLGHTDEIEALRQLAFNYWEAFNSYDADQVLSYLEEDYRKERESAIRRDIGRIKLFKVKLGVSEESPPQMTGPGEGEMFLRMKEPLGTRRIRMAFREVEDGWKITYSQEVK